MKLLSGYEMPMLGLGTWDLRGSDGTRAVATALEMGYRHVDTAWMYENQQVVGEGIRASRVPYDEIFLTSKIWHTHLAADQVRAQHEENLSQLGFDYVDLLLIHWPKGEAPLGETLGAFAELVDEGKTRSIGVSNFSEALVDEAREVSDKQICVNQVKYNLREAPNALRQHCQQRRIAITAYTPTAKGSTYDEPAVTAAAQAHGKTPAQICLRWLVQQEIIVIPKAASEMHQRENMALFDWALSEAEMVALSAIAS
ncbi:MAG: aldo/keto reductase [Candidatus Latescibacterota bacterium]|nr:aldo/keto reductase [Candidatus Latescibacterota bacterium]